MALKLDTLYAFYDNQVDNCNAEQTYRENCLFPKNIGKDI